MDKPSNSPLSRHVNDKTSNVDGTSEGVKRSSMAGSADLVWVVMESDLSLLRGRETGGV